MSLIVRLLSHRRVVRFVHVALGGLLIWAALAKLGDIPALARQIDQFRILPMTFTNALAIVLPWIELTAGLSLLLGIRSRAGAFVAVGMLLVFTAAVALAVVRGVNIECGCFGAAGAVRTGGAKLLENLGILALAVVGVLRPRVERTPE